MSRFTLIEWPERGGHKLFWDEDKPGRIAIADLSGGQPDTTDDGVLYVDETEEAEFLFCNTYGEPRWRLPLVTPSGRKVSTVTSIQTVQRIKRIIAYR
tara:strand:+ start:2201 stop:2494 length:294 start_codon:yes stop_codon:yes gene_type:complete